MKRIENSKSFRVCNFVFMLTLLLLLSSTIGIIVAEKPDKPPGKPDNPGPKPPTLPPLYEFYVSIGETGDDLDLVSSEYITMVSHVDSCGWNWPPKKGIRSGGWSADTSSPWNPLPDFIFAVNIVADPYLPAPVVEPDIFYISHYWSYQKVIEFGNQPIDFWELMLSWGFEDHNSARTLRIWTDWGPEMEGEYALNAEGEVEVWTVDFNNAIWELYAYDENYYGYLLADGTIGTGFDVTIVKGDLVT